MAGAVAGEDQLSFLAWQAQYLLKFTSNYSPSANIWAFGQTPQKIVLRKCDLQLSYVSAACVG